MRYDILFWKVKIAWFTCPNYNIYLAGIFKRFFGLVDPVKNMFYIVAFCLYKTHIMPYEQNQLLLVCIKVLLDYF